MPKIIIADDLANIADEQPRWMGVAAPPKSKESDYFILVERKELKMSDHKCSNHHALCVGYTVTDALIVP